MRLKSQSDRAANAVMEKTKVFLLCSGLGCVRRGFESFTRECFDALKTDDTLEVHLFRGSGARGDRERSLWNLDRSGWASRLAARLLSSNPYKIEQITFVVALLPQLAAKQSEVVMFSDGSVGNVLWHYRRHFSQRFSLLFSNGDPLQPPFPRWDHIQQVSPRYWDWAARAGVPPKSRAWSPMAST